MTDDRWVTLAEAAVILGKSSRTIRRYVAAGKLEINREVSPHLVNVADMADTVAGDGGQVADEWRSKADKWRTEADRLAKQAQELQATIEGLRSDRQALQSEAQELRAKVDRLTAVLAEVRDALQDARRERDDWKAAHAQSLRSLQTSQHLLEHVEEREDRPGWLERLLPWLGGRE